VNEYLGGSYYNTLYIDSVSFAGFHNLLLFDYGSHLQKGQPHTLTLSAGYLPAAVGTTIVYSEV
jgi:hypothetical protein